MLILRNDRVDHSHFHTRAWIAVAGAIACVYLVTPLSGRAADQYEVAGILLGFGLILSVPIYLHRRSQGEHLEMSEPEELS